MEISELTLKIIILLIPGAICVLFIETLVVHKKWNPFKFIVYSVLSGVFSYVILQLFVNFYDFVFSFCKKVEYELVILDTWKTILEKNILPYDEVIYASLIAIVFGFILSFIIQNKLTNRFAQYLGVSKKYGDENLYSFFLNSDAVQEIYFRDSKNKLTYHGIVEAFSEQEGISEILLSNVSVYDYESSELCYEMDKIYLCRSSNELSIELPKNIIKKWKNLILRKAQNL